MFFFNSISLYDFIKDCLYFTKPILFIILGYFLINSIKDKEFLFKTVIYIAFFSALIHLFNVFTFLLDAPFNINPIRNYAGKSNYIEMLAIVFLLINNKNEFFTLKIKYKKILKIVIFGSFILYFSRTAFVGALIFILASKGYLKLNVRSLTYLFLLILSVGLFYAYLYSIELERNSTGIEGFLYKMKLAPEEIFAPDNNFDVRNHANLWDHWRAYEASKALNQIMEVPYYLGLMFGNGFGALIDLGFKAPLGGTKMQFIPIIHNGYMNIMFKTGVLGLIFYFIFLAYLYFKAYFTTFSLKEKLINNLISGVSVFYLFTTLIITGIYNKSDIIVVALGGFIALSNYYSVKFNR